MLNTHNANLCAVCRGLGAPLLPALIVCRGVLATEVLPNIIRQRYKMKQQLIILWSFWALAYSAAIDTTISPIDSDEEITTILPNYDDAEELIEYDEGKDIYYLMKRVPF